MGTIIDEQLVTKRKSDYRREYREGLRERTPRSGSVIHAYNSGSVQTWVDLLRSRSHWQDSCWNWLGEFDGQTAWTTIGVARRRVNRIYFELTGELDHTKRVVSLCGNLQCVNPDHREARLLRRYAFDDIQTEEAAGSDA